MDDNCTYRSQGWTLPHSDRPYHVLWSIRTITTALLKKRTLFSSKGQSVMFEGSTFDHSARLERLLSGQCYPVLQPLYRGFPNIRVTSLPHPDNRIILTGYGAGHLYYFDFGTVAMYRAQPRIWQIRISVRIGPDAFVLVPNPVSKVNRTTLHQLVSIF